ncbi:hypothetical protein C8A05DRAFT_13739 [Staphylotrichum tortipilum]|uniref:Uncharacterized protein n=1 Tax=Staphylotrichum tortipilum TaxID=2831512 RepID=A0AAN6RW72_9PEZI|nr:hypothetical protein C8A05DRAFT_13739 [Staphylotrichum longicolle]
MPQPSNQQQVQWGKALAGKCQQFPRIASCLSTGITTDPEDLIQLISTPKPESVALRAAFDVIETYLSHLEYEHQRDHQDLQDQLNKATAALAKAVVNANPDREKPGRRLTTDPDRFSGEEKDIAKRQVNFVNWRSQVGRVVQTDDHIYTTEFAKLQYAAGRLTGEAYWLFQDRFDKLTEKKDQPQEWPWKTVSDLFAELNGLYATMDLGKFRRVSIYRHDCR